MSDDPSPTTKSALSGATYGLLGLGALLVVVLAVVLLFRDGDPRMNEALEQAEGVESIRETSLNVGWVPPAADIDPGQLIPQAFGGWDLETSDTSAGNPAFGLTREGHHGRYNRAGEPVGVDLYVYPGQEDDAATVDAVRERLSDTARFGEVRFSEPALVPGAKTLQFDMAPGEADGENAGVPEAHGLLAAVEGWLLFVRSDAESELRPFLAAYMTAVEADGAGEAPPEPAPGDRTGPISPGGGRPGN